MAKEFDISEKMQVLADEAVQVLGEAGLQLTYETPHDEGCSTGYVSKGKSFEDARRTYLRKRLSLMAEQDEPHYAALHHLDISLHVPAAACIYGRLIMLEATSGRIVSAETTASGLVELQNVTTVHGLGRHITDIATYTTGVRSRIYSFKSFDEAQQSLDIGMSSERHTETTMNLPSNREWAEKTQTVLTFLRSVLGEQQALGELRLEEEE